MADRAFYGSMLFGWGLFNRVEGIIDHHILKLHHVVKALGQSVWDWIFLLASPVLTVTGLIVARGRRSAVDR